MKNSIELKEKGSVVKGVRGGKVKGSGVVVSTESLLNGSVSDVEVKEVIEVVDAIVVKQQRVKRDAAKLAGNKAKASEMALESVNDDVWKGVDVNVRKGVYEAAKKRYFAELQELDRVDRVKELIVLIESLDSVTDNPVLMDARSELKAKAKGSDFKCVFCVVKGNGVEFMIKYDGSCLYSVSASGTGAKLLPWIVFVDRYNCSIDKVCADKYKGVLGELDIDAAVLRYKELETAFVKDAMSGLVDEFGGKAGWNGTDSKLGNAYASHHHFNVIMTKASGRALGKEKKAVIGGVKKDGVTWY